MKLPRWRRAQVPAEHPRPLTFTTRLPSSLAGIHFTAHFDIGCTPSPPAVSTPASVQWAAWIRRAVREKASRIAARQHPYDPDAAADAVLTELPHPVVGYGDPRAAIFIQEATFTLDDAARTGLAEYDKSQRQAQQQRDTLAIQTRALREVLAHPGLARSWLIRNTPELLDKVTTKEAESLLDAIGNAGPPPEPALWQDPLIDVLHDLVSPLRNSEDRVILLTKVEQILKHLDRADLAHRLSRNGTEGPPKRT